MLFFLLFPVLALGETELQGNTSSNAYEEDDESFQDQEHYYDFRHCNDTALEEWSMMWCGTQFNKRMADISPESQCDWEQVIKPYNELTKCMEVLSVSIGCYFPNHVVQDFFILIHSQYFQECPEEEQLFLDEPLGVVITLTLIPVSIIPFLVFQIIRKSKARN